MEESAVHGKNPGHPRASDLTVLPVHDCPVPDGAAHAYPASRTFRWGYLLRICDCLLKLADPTMAPGGKSARHLATGLMKTSRTSSRGRLQGRMVPAGR